MSILKTARLNLVTISFYTHKCTSGKEKISDERFDIPFISYVLFLLTCSAVTKHARKFLRIN